MLGWVAAVRATESPSQLRPALIHRTWTTSSSGGASVTDTADLQEWTAGGVRGPLDGHPGARMASMSGFSTHSSAGRRGPTLGAVAWVVTAEERGSFKRCRRAWDLGARTRRGLEPIAAPGRGALAARCPRRPLLPGHVGVGPGHRPAARASGGRCGRTGWSSATADWARRRVDRLRAAAGRERLRRRRARPGRARAGTWPPRGARPSATAAGSTPWWSTPTASTGCSSTGSDRASDGRGARASTRRCVAAAVGVGAPSTSTITIRRRARTTRSGRTAGSGASVPTARRASRSHDAAARLGWEAV